jgi:hypothetical protein
MGPEQRLAELLKLEAEIEAVTAAIHNRKVVSIRRIRALKNMRIQCDAQRLLVLLDKRLIESGREMFLVFSPFMVEHLRDRCPPGIQMSDESILSLARKVAGDGWFRRMNSKLRVYHAMYKKTPWVEVRTHWRAGKRIEMHGRYLGNQHLLDLPLDEASDVVVRLVKALAGVVSRFLPRRDVRHIRVVERSAGG